MSDVDELWAAEAKRRRDEVREGRVKTIPGDAAFLKVGREVAARRCAMNSTRMRWRSSRSLRLPGVAIIHALVLALWPYNLEAKPPEGDQPTMTVEDFVNSMRYNPELKYQVIPGYWLGLLIADDPETVDGLKHGAVTLQECRITSDVQLSNRSFTTALIMKDVIINGGVYVSNSDQPVVLRWDKVEVQGRVWLEFSSKPGSRSVEVRWSDVTVRDEVRLLGPANLGDIRFSQVNIGRDFLMGVFGPQPFAFFFEQGKIGGDMLVFDNGRAHPQAATGQGATTAPAPLSGLALISRNLAVSGRTIFRDSNFSVLDMDTPGAGDLVPFQVTGRATFERVHAARAHLAHAIFKQEVRFVGCDFPELWLDGAIFEKDVSFFLTTFGTPRPADSPVPPDTETDSWKWPPRGGLSVEDTRFEGKLRLAWDRVEKPGPWWRPWIARPACITGWTAPEVASVEWLRAKPVPASIRAWENLHETWKASGNTEAANEADYWSKRAESRGRSVSLWVWGFGYRPIRPLFWMAFVVLGCAGLYTSRVPRSTPNVRLFLTGDGLQLESTSSRQSWRQRFRAAVRFSMRAAWEWKYGWENTRGWFWSGLALAEQAAVKVLLLLFAKALANTSPLLKEITDKLLPFS